MTKVVIYLFDSMFQGKKKISYTEKMIVVITTAMIITTSILFIL